MHAQSAREQIVSCAKLTRFLPAISTYDNKILRSALSFIAFHLGHWPVDDPARAGQVRKLPRNFLRKVNRPEVQFEFPATVD